MKILIVEDDTETAAFVVANLAASGHVADQAASGPTGYDLATSGRYDVIVLDRMLPDFDGITLVKTLRSAGIATPVLFLTHLSGIDDRVDGLEAGGDDYLVKPFAIEELLARLAALARRPQLAGESGFFAVADLEMDLIRRAVRRGGEPIELLPREFQLLEYLMRSQGRIVTRTMLLEQVWNFHFDPKTNIVETHISRLRAKIDRGRPVALIQTLRGVGYALREP
ncbi:MAG: response regulator transcription factor [Ancalomicrobiaceae bacterium]|nr:response regulator transcription factor [Ancalomicrobiaceae bacterium]